MDGAVFSNILKDYGFLIGNLTGSLAAYLLGLVVSHYKRERKWLGYAITNRNVVRSDRTDLTIQYRGEDISTLDSHTVAVKNMGNRALSKLPIRIDAVEGSRILDFEVVAPGGATFEVIRPNERQLFVTYDLLQPTEEGSIGLTVADSLSGDLELFARAENVSVIPMEEGKTSPDELIGLVEVLPGLGFAARIARVGYRLYSRRQTP